MSGTTGVNLSKYAELFESVSKRKLEIIKFESLLDQKIAEAIGLYFQNPLGFSKIIHEAIDKLWGRIFSSEAEIVILLTHLSYFRRDFIVPNPLLVLWNIKNLNIKAVILIIDDYYHALLNIARRSRKVPIDDIIDPLGYLNWRSMDLALAIMLRVGNFNVHIIGAKHDKETFIRLAKMVIDGKKFFPVYFSHPISALRRRSIETKTPLLKLTDVEEIEDVKRRLRKNCGKLILYEPTTVDEKIYGESGLKTSISKDDRWPHSDETIVGFDYPIDLQSNDFREIFDIKMLNDEVYLKAMERTIDNQIRLRDFHYIDQSNALIVYRPTMSGRISRGVSAELQRASAKGLPVWVFIPEEYSTELKQFSKSSLFDRPPNVNLVKNIDQLINIINSR